MGRMMDNEFISSGLSSKIDRYLALGLFGAPVLAGLVWRSLLVGGVGLVVAAALLWMERRYLILTAAALLFAIAIFQIAFWLSSLKEILTGVARRDHDAG